MEKERLGETAANSAADTDRLDDRGNTAENRNDRQGPTGIRRTLYIHPSTQL